MIGRQIGNQILVADEPLFDWCSGDSLVLLFDAFWCSQSRLLKLFRLTELSLKC